jgi:hypothetical protein
MKRALFLAQFRRTVIPFGLVIVAVDAGIAILEWSIRHGSKDIDHLEDVMSVLALLIFTALAIPLGATAFSRDFKEKHHLFIHSLPLPLETMWAVINGANFAAMACCLGILFAFRPSLFALPSSAPELYDPVHAMVAFEVLCTLFLAGSCFALCFRRDLLAYLVAIFSIGGMFGGIMALAVVCGSAPGLNLVDPHPGIALVGLGCVILLLALLSRQFFVAGEITLLRVQFRNTALVLCGLIGILVVLSTALSLGLFSRFDPWVFERWSTGVSPEGKYLLIQERREQHQQFGRLTILDVQSGKVVRQSEYTGLKQAGALANGAVLLAVANELPLGRLFYLLPPSDALLQLPAADRPGQKQETRFPSTDIWSWWPQYPGNGKLLVEMSKKDGVKVVSYDTATGQVTDTCAGESGTGAQVQSYRDGMLVCLFGSLARGNQAATPSSVWWLGETEKKIPWSGRATPARPDCVVHQVAFADIGPCVQKLKELYPIPAAWTGVGGYLLPASGFGMLYASEKTPVFYLRMPGKEPQATLLVWNRSQSAWTTVAENLPVHESLGRMLASGYVRGAYGNPMISPQAGMVLYYLREPSGVAVYLYDAERGSTLKLGVVSGPTAPGLGLAPAKDTVIVHIGTMNRPLMRFRYEPRSGRLTSLSLPPATQESEAVLYADEAGNQLVSRGTAIYRRNADTSEIQLWPRL